MVTRSILRPVLRPVTRAVSDTIRGFNPRSLFAAGEQGIWLDPSDFSTLFQDAAGATPVTALGQPVGLALDKRLGLALGSEKKGNGAIAIGGSATDATYNTTTGIGSCTRVDAANQSYVTVTALAVNNHAISISNTGSIDLFIRAGTGVGPVAYSILAGQTLTSRLLTTGGAFSVTANTGTATFVVNSVREIAGNHASQTTSASRPTLQQDSNGLYYLSFDGTNDGMATPSINFTGTNKMTVWAGVRKNSDAAIGIVCELSANLNASNGSFFITAPATASSNIGFSSKGTVGVGAIAYGIASPSTLVVTGIGDIAAPSTSARINGVVAASNAFSQGSGNYGNYPLYIGRRNNASLPFNGRIYQLIVRGAESNAGQIAATEAWCNGKTRAYA